MNIIHSDLNYGIPQEPTIISKLGEYFMEDIQQESNPYSRFDAKSTTTKYEIKSRRNTHDKYPTTMIGVNKANVSGRLVFVFSFTNGLYYIVYEKEKFDKYEIRDIEATRMVRGKAVKNLKPCYMIDIDDLIKIDL
jgi:hypothetical protein